MRVVKTDKNGGYGYGNNYGVQIAKDLYDADYTIISNPDVKFTENLICDIIDTFIEDEGLAVVSAIQNNGYTGKAISNSGWRIPSFWDYLAASLIIINRLTRKNRLVQIDPSLTVQYVECVPGAFLVVDTDRFIRAGGYDERIFLFCEESILGYRIREAGYKTALLTKNYYEHFHSTSIKKSIPQEISRHKLVLNSRKQYFDNYLHVSRFKHILASIVFSISIFEYRILFMIKK